VIALTIEPAAAGCTPNCHLGRGLIPEASIPALVSMPETNRVYAIEAGLVNAAAGPPRIDRDQPGGMLWLIRNTFSGS
jgi:hypothetical protein